MDEEEEEEFMPETGKLVTSIFGEDSEEEFMPGTDQFLTKYLEKTVRMKGKVMKKGAKKKNCRHHRRHRHLRLPFEFAPCTGSLHCRHRPHHRHLLQTYFEML